MSNRDRLLQLTLLVAVIPPLKRKYEVNQHTKVPWSLIEELRQEFEKAGIDWRATKKLLEAANRAKVPK